jgi:maltooligosyltrehalose trehalohydrolase
MLTVCRQLIALRRRYPDLSDPRLDRVEVTYGEHHVMIRRGRCLVVANFGREPAVFDLPTAAASIVYTTSDSAAVVDATLTVPPAAAVVVQRRRAATGGIT